MIVRKNIQPGLTGENAANSSSAQDRRMIAEKTPEP
jgi:hypothetical protein